MSKIIWKPGVRADTWTDLRQYTSARLALGRAGGSIPTAEILALRLAHARAQDAVHCLFDAVSLATTLQAGDRNVLILDSAAQDRNEYLLRPDLGRRLAPASAAKLKQHAAPPEGEYDVALMVSDGLSPTAVAQHAATFVDVFVAGAQTLGWRLAPLVVIRGGRVAIQDEVGNLLGAKTALILLGERPGLGSADSMGAYLVYQPALGKTDADRNCLSNLHNGGLAPELGARKALYLLQSALRLGLSGISLKDDGGILIP